MCNVTNWRTSPKRQLSSSSCQIRVGTRVLLSRHQVILTGANGTGVRIQNPAGSFENHYSGVCISDNVLHINGKKLNVFFSLNSSTISEYDPNNLMNLSACFNKISHNFGSSILKR
jgi:hypothetical protein